MTISLDELIKDVTPAERALVAARTAELVAEELTLRGLRQARDHSIAGDARRTPSRRGRPGKQTS